MLKMVDIWGGLYLGLKHWILPKDHFKTHLNFSIFGWGDPFQLGSRSEGGVKTLKLSREAIWQVSVTLSGKFHYFFLTLPLASAIGDDLIRYFYKLVMLWSFLANHQ